MQNSEIGRILGEISDMLEVTGANFFRVRAYRNAARAVLDYPASFADLTTDQMAKVPGIGKDLSQKIETLVKTGALEIHRELSAQVPPGVFALMHLPGLGPKRAMQLSRELGIQDLAQLKTAVEAGALRSIRGLGPKMEEKLLEHLSREQTTTPKRWLYSDAAVEVDALLEYLRRCDAVEHAEAAGSFRRRRDTVGDLDMLAISSAPAEVTSWINNYPRAAKTLGSGETKTTLMLHDGLQVDVRILSRASYGAALIYFTGSQAHCIHIRKIAQKMHLSLNEYGLMRAGESIAGATEHEVYAKLGMAWITPELREDRGEVEAALENRLPRLVERADLRGDLHTHSTYTDGRASIEEMARAAKKRGLEYFAVTDHSQRLTMVHGLDPARLREQWREIEKVEAAVGGIRLLRGIEVDILEDGSLDLPDDVLGELDWVVASVHSKMRQPTPEMTRRVIKAMRNPNVDVIGHPTGRLIDKREGSNFDLGEVLRVAREEGCALEVNSQANRQDLIDTSCMAAKHAGVKLVISTDSHSTTGFNLVELGLAQARRGWIEPSDVLNTRPLKDLRQRH